MAHQMVQQGLLNPQGAAPAPTGQAAAAARISGAAGRAAQQASGGGEQSSVELLSPGDVANMLKVSEGDVLATIESGELKAKKIGSTYRITRAALDEFFAK